MHSVFIKYMHTCTKPFPNPPIFVAQCTRQRGCLGSNIKKIPENNWFFGVLRQVEGSRQPSVIFQFSFFWANFFHNLTIWIFFYFTIWKINILQNY